MDWQHRIADVIADDGEGLLPASTSSPEHRQRQQEGREAAPGRVDLQFPLRQPPDAVAENYGLNKVIGDNETGFGHADDPYRMEAWEFLLAGGGLYNNLDYSFTVGHEDGTFAYPDPARRRQPEFREQMKVLKDFLYGFDFVRLKPDPSVVKTKLPKDCRCQSWLKAATVCLVFSCLPGEEVNPRTPQGGI